MHLEAAHLKEIHEILAFYGKGLPVYAFGSRVHGRMLKRTSDLDLCVRGGQRVDEKRMRKLRDTFDISDLPFRVDVVDWHDLSEDFRKLIEKDLEPITATEAPAR
jgi:predicted nucleotidyltransferase